MRVQHRIAALVGAGVLLLGGQRLNAQNPPGAYPPGAYPYAAPTFPAGAYAPPTMPGAYSPGASAGIEGYPAPVTANGPANYSASLSSPEYASQPYPSSIPPVPPSIVDGSTVQPYPAISPFDFTFSNHFNLGGLWKHREETRDREYYFNVDFLFMQTKRPEGVFGNPDAQSYTRQVRDFLNGAATTGGGTGATGGATTQLLISQGFNATTPAFLASQFNNFNAVNLSELGDLNGDGGRMTLGWWNPDKSGFAVNFWGGVGNRDYNAQDYSTRQFVNKSDFIKLIRLFQQGVFDFGGVQADEGGLVNTSTYTPLQLFEQNLMNLRGLPVKDDTARGQTIPYDLYFGIKFASQVMGTGLDYYFTPLIDEKWFTLNPTVGFKYYNIRESMSFLGVDSGLLYSPLTQMMNGLVAPARDWKAQSLPNGIDEDKDGIVDNAFIPEPGSPGGTTSGGTNTFLLGFPSPFSLIPATIDVTTLSNIFGPDAGIRYQFGSKSFHVIGETKFGVLANLEQISLRGDNIGSTTRVNGQFVAFPPELVGVIAGTTNTLVRPENHQDLIIASQVNPDPNRFSSSESHSHATAMIEQSLMLEARIFEYIPVLRKIWPLDTANFRGGYTFTWLSSVIETNRSVFYQGDPMAGLFPEIRASHDGWYTGNWNVGVSWDW